MARPKEKESTHCNIKLEVGSKQRLTELANLRHTSRTKIIEVLIDAEHDRVFNSKPDQTGEATILARALMAAGLESLRRDGGASLNRPTAPEAPAAAVPTTPRRAGPGRPPK